jgi:transcriptional regulator with XRE-family HTH domain
MTPAEPLGFDGQLRLLIEAVPAADGVYYTVGALAEALAMPRETLHKLLRGRSESPRLATVRRIARFYGITLDYFDCSTVDACRAYLMQRQMQHAPTLQAVTERSAVLTERGQHTLLAMIDWLRRRTT